MSTEVNQIRASALALPVVERAALVEDLLASLDLPDPRVDALWATEAEDRLAEYRAGEMESIPAEDLLEAQGETL